jgi:short-subunit dehydrogenase
MERERAAVLVGAAAPWGRLLARGLAHDGWAVVLVDDPRQGLAEVHEQLLAADASAEMLPADWSDLAGVLALPSKLPGTLPPPSLLVHALAPPVVGRFDARPVADIESEVHRGYSALVAFAHRLLPGMIARGSGRVIVLGSAAARAPLAKAAAHSAAAGALPPFLTSLEREVFRQGVGVTYLEPAGFPSPPVPGEVAGGTEKVHAEHRRFLLSDASVARAFALALRAPHLRHWRFHGHDRLAPPPSLLRRYAEREFHGLDPEPAERHDAPSYIPERDLAGKIALVTGSSRGIGRAIALRLASHGMRVLLTGRDEGALVKVADEVRGRGGQAEAFVQDLLDPRAAEGLVAFTTETWGTPWLLVNNAGLGYFKRLVRQSDRELTVQLTVDLLALLRVTRAFLPSMLTEGKGQVLNVGSMAPEVPLPRLAPYSGIKGAVKGLTISLHRELAHRGISASVLEPVTVDTEFIGRGSEPGRRDIRSSRLLTSVIISPAVVGRLAERTVLVPEPVVFVPPRARLFHAMYRATLPVMDRVFRLPPSTVAEPAPSSA